MIYLTYYGLYDYTIDYLSNISDLLSSQYICMNIYLHIFIQYVGYLNLICN